MRVFNLEDIKIKSIPMIFISCIEAALKISK